MPDFSFLLHHEDQPTFAHFTDAVEYEAWLALAAESPQQVHTAMTLTGPLGTPALVHV